MKRMWCQQRKRHIHQKKRLKNPEIDPQKYAQLILDKGAKFKEGRIVFSTNSTRTTGHYIGRENKIEMNLNLNLTTYIKINST